MEHPMARPQSFDPEAALDDAMQLFWAHGFEATSIDDIVEHLQISRPAVYRQWGSKENLYKQALERYRSLGHAQFLADLKANPHQAIEIVHQRLAEIVHDTHNDPEMKGCFVVNATCERSSSDPDTQAQVSESLTNLEQQLTQALRAAQKSGVQLHNDPADLARFVVVVIQGIRVVGKARPTRAALKGIVDVTMKALTANTKPRSPKR
jgi:TetR/AcrR family transcriptional regulator, transcriptional repressor for nem operon